MSLVAVHGPQMWGGVGAQGGGSGAVVTAGPVQATADMTNGLKFTFQVNPASVRNPLTDLVWTFPGATVVPASPLTGNGPFVCTYATPGSKTATLTVSGVGTPAVPANGTYPITVSADTAPGGQVIDNDGGTVTSDPVDGLKFTLAGKGDRAAADYDWTFSDGTTAILNTKSTTVTFTTAGTKTITLTLGTSGGTTPAGGTYTYQVTATTGAQPRGLQAPPDGGGAPAGFDPSAHTVQEVEEYVTTNPDQAQAIYDLEVDGKARVTLITWLEEFEA